MPLSWAGPAADGSGCKLKLLVCPPVGCEVRSGVGLGWLGGCVRETDYTQPNWS